MDYSGECWSTVVYCFSPRSQATSVECKTTLNLNFFITESAFSSAFNTLTKNSIKDADTQQPWEIALDTIRYRRYKKCKDKEHFRTDSVSYIKVQE